LSLLDGRSEAFVLSLILLLFSFSSAAGASFLTSSGATEEEEEIRQRVYTRYKEMKDGSERPAVEEDWDEGDREYEAYVSLGGIKWIRETLRAHKKEMVNEAHQKSPLSLKEKA
jgi:hypothetical protein